MSEGYRIDQMQGSVRDVVRRYELDNGDGIINASDRPLIEKAMVRTDVDPAAQEIIQAVGNAMTNPLAVPRDRATAQAAQALANSPTPAEQIRTLSSDQMKALEVGERIRVINDLADAKGVQRGFWSRTFGTGVSNEMAQKIVEVLQSTPDHQVGQVMDELTRSGLNAKILKGTRP